MSLQTDRPPRPADEPSTDVRSTDTETPTLPDDDIFHILQTNRRRDAIRYLLEKNDAVKMRDVAEYVAAKENDTTVAELSSTERQRVYIPLYQSHLPKLDKEGIIEYNKSRGIVRPTEKLELFRPYLELGTDDESEDEEGTLRTLGQRYTVLAVASASLLLSSAVGVYAAISAVETSFALALVVGAVAVPGMVLGTIATALLAFTIGRNYVSSLLPTDAKPLK
ncbi:hypothetical protein CV102_03720 [Natronococcus pandeyae]|uniref:DUF7344 domain-containing protein n=1 Tax=Natronococcus pandeyae TaxID=2055836 RepID=A0A8J8Q753_9EURY|nr:hypothetical protein [Natronococcus pandeyae]TYL40681.1 hypothetical protein CV102_03720 [Natronococcus pandeyae]